jgi:hypothetical protein
MMFSEIKGWRDAASREPSQGSKRILRGTRRAINTAHSTSLVNTREQSSCESSCKSCRYPDPPQCNGAHVDVYQSIRHVRTILQTKSE